MELKYDWNKILIRRAIAVKISNEHMNTWRDTE